MINSTRFSALSAHCWKWIKPEDYEQDRETHRATPEGRLSDPGEYFERRASKPLARFADFWVIDRLAARRQRAPSGVTKH